LTLIHDAQTHEHKKNQSTSLLSAFEKPISTAAVFMPLEGRLGNLSNAILKLDDITDLNVFSFHSSDFQYMSNITLNLSPPV